MDHSCVPNASVSFNGSNIVIRALACLGGGGGAAKFDFAKDVKISYIDLMEHTAVRQAELFRRCFINLITLCTFYIK